MTLHREPGLPNCAITGTPDEKLPICSHAMLKTPMHTSIFHKVLVSKSITALS